MKTISKGIFKLNKKKLNLIKVSNYKQLIKEANSHPRLRSRILYHESSESLPQHMLICFNKDSVVEVSFHRFAESFLILEGIAHYRFYSNKNGTVFHDVRMSPAKLKGIFYTFISPYIAHRFFPLSTNIIANEIGYSKFSSKNTFYGTGKTFKTANNLKNSQIGNEILVRSNNTKFKDEKNDIITFKSQSGIAELSYNDVEELIKLKKKPFFLIPSYKAQKKRFITNLQKKFWFCKKIKKKKIFCENSIITIIHGESILEYEAKKIYLNETRIVVGPLKNLKISIKNNKSQVLILHIANEK